MRAVLQVRADMTASEGMTAVTFALKVGAMGNVRTTTVKAFPENAYRKIVEAV